MTMPKGCNLRMSGSGRRVTALAAGALLLSTLSLSGCATSIAGSSLMDARAEAPAPPKTNAYPALGPRPNHAAPAMTADELSKIKKDLNSARNRQAPDDKNKRGVARP